MTRSAARPYQRRRRGPVVAVVSVLAVVAMLTWTIVLLSVSGPAGAASCPVPSAGPPPGEALASDVLDSVTPVPPATVRVTVLNAGGQRGQANLVAAQLGDLGFAEAAPPANDPFYPDGDMECTGQLRFGPAGEAAASTVALVLPCAELIRDARADDAVDVSVGTAFGDLNPVRAVRDALEQLGAPGPDDGDASDPQNVDAQNGAPATPTVVEPAVLEEARDAAC